jgi:hypothetical protein
MIGDRIRCTVCGLWTNEPEGHPLGAPGICWVCRTHPGPHPIVTAPDWEGRMRRVLPADGKRGYGR